MNDKLSDWWAKCVGCAYMKGPVIICIGCTRNPFAPCGASKTDEYVKAVADE
jgi:hypothetical protein